MEINFDKLQDEILDIQEERNNENRIVANKISQFLKTRKNKRFDFTEIKECVNRNTKPSISYFNHEEGMGWMERFSLSVNNLVYLPEENDFAAVGHISGKEKLFRMFGHDMDMESLYNLVDWLAQYQREQNGTARTTEEIERERIEEEFGKEYFTNDKYRLYIETQLEPEERILLALYNTETDENLRQLMPMTPRTTFALVLRKL